MNCVFGAILAVIVAFQHACGMGRIHRYFFPDSYKFSNRIKQQNIPGYTVNLQWINAKLKPEQKYIHPSSNFLSIRKNLLFSLYAWARKNPNARGIVLWYDGKFTTPAAVEGVSSTLCK